MSNDKAQKNAEEIILLEIEGLLKDMTDWMGFPNPSFHGESSVDGRISFISSTFEEDELFNALEEVRVKLKELRENDS